MKIEQAIEKLRKCKEAGMEVISQETFGDLLKEEPKEEGVEWTVGNLRISTGGRDSNAIRISDLKDSCWGLPMGKYGGRGTITGELLSAKQANTLISYLYFAIDRCK